MRWLVLLVWIVASQAGAAAPVAALPAGAFIVLCYHEVRSDVRDYPDPYAVDSGALVAQFAWLRGNGYVPVSLDAIIAARQGGKPLPPKAILLTFDDAYLSFYTQVYPLLREFRFPAVLAVVGSWIDNPPVASPPLASTLSASTLSAGTLKAGTLKAGPLATPAQYGEKSSVAQASFPTWGQLREMAASGLVEIASHSYDLHRGVLANPQGNLQPAATARIYDAATGSYENDASWRARVRADLARNAQVIEREIGRRPRAVAWPYGSYNDELVRIAGELGSPVALALGEEANTVDVPLTAVRRILVSHNPSLAEFVAEVRGPEYPKPVRAVGVSLDDVHSADPVEQERNLAALLDRIQLLQPTHVYLQASADTDGDGIADAVYFPNRHLPVRADLFNRVAWQLATRTDVKVLASLSLTQLRLPPHAIAEVYEDLARHANFDGLLFGGGDIATAPGAAATAEASIGMTQASIGLTHQIAARVSAFRAPMLLARSLQVAPLPASQQPLSFHQSLTGLLAAYDQVALLLPVLPPSAEGSADARLVDLAARVAQEPGNPAGRRKAVFMLYHPGMRAGLAQDAALMARQMRALQRGGTLNFGYSLDDFRHDLPPLVRIAPALSLRVHPAQPEKASAP